MKKEYKSILSGSVPRWTSRLLILLAFLWIAASSATAQVTGVPSFVCQNVYAPYTGGLTTAIGLSATTPNNYYLLFREDATGTFTQVGIVKNEFGGPATYGDYMIPGKYICYDFGSSIPDPINFNLGTLQSGSVWIYEKPVVETIQFPGSICMNGSAGVFCASSGGVINVLSEGTSSALGSSWDVVYRLYNASNVQIGSSQIGTGGTLSFTGAAIVPGVYHVTAQRGGSCTELLMTGALEVQNDVAAPTGASVAPISVQCHSLIPAPNIDDVVGEVDNCPASLVITWVSDVSNGLTCPETVTRTYNVKDGCNNSINVFQTITVSDTEFPFAGTVEDVDVQCIGDVPTPNIGDVVGESDNCTAAPLVAFVGDVSDGNTCPEVITRTYSVTDDCHHTSFVTQTITVDDNIAPVVNEAPGALNGTFSIANVPAINAAMAMAPTATDNCTAEPLISAPVVVSTPDPNCPDGYVMTRTWTFTDACGNPSLPYTQTIIVNAGAPVTSLTNVTVCTGYNFTVDVNVTPFTNVTGISLAINYDATKITYLGYQTPLNPILAGISNVVNGANSYIYISGFPSMSNFQGPLLQTLRFTHITGNTNLTFSSLLETENEYAWGWPNAFSSTPFCDNPFNTYYIGSTITEKIWPTVNAGQDATICVGETYTLVGEVGGGATAGRWSGGTGTFTPSDVALGAVYHPSNGDIAAGHVTLTLTTTDAYPCVDISDDMILTFNRVTSGSVIPAQTICEGTAPGLLTTLVAATHDGVISYQWESSIDGLSFAPISLATSETYQAGALNVDTWYRRVATSTLNGVACSATSEPVKITVNNLTAGSIQNDQTICEGSIPALLTTLVAPTYDGVISYQWESSSDGLSFAPISLATSEDYQAGALVADTWYERIAISTLDGVVCSKTSAPVKVTVNNVTAGSIIPAQTICEGTAPALLTTLVSATHDGVISYQWESSTDGSSFAPIALATDETYQPGTLVVDTWYQRIATSTLNGVACSVTSAPIKVTVNNVTAGTIQMAQTICEGTAPALLTTLTGATYDGVISYQWESSTDGLSFAPISLATDETYQAGTLSVDMWYKRVAYSTLGEVICSATSEAVKITVNNVTAGSIQNDQTICEGTAPALLTTLTSATYDGVVSYQWESSIDGLSFAPISLATAEDYQAGTLGVDTWYQRVATSTLNGVACSSISNSIKVTVNNVTAGTIQMDQTICEGTIPALLTTLTSATYDGVISYQWESSTDGLSFAPISLATDETYQAGSLLVDTWYQRIATSTLDGITCSATSGAVKVTVNNVTAGEIGNNQTICEGDVPELLVTEDAAIFDGVITYQWASSIDGLSFAPISLATDETYQAGALLVDTWYQRTATSTLNGVACSATSAAIKITVNNFTSGNAILTDQTICSGLTVSMTGDVVTADGSITYQWQSSSSFGGTYTNVSNGGTDQNYTSVVLTADTWFKRVAYSTLNGKVCELGSNIIKITVQLRSTITGSVKYFKLGGSLNMNNVNVALKQGVNTIAFANTDNSGNYTIPDVCPGTYNIILTTSKGIAGAINSTDAAQANAWKFTGAAIDYVRFYAGDVTGGGISGHGAAFTYINNNIDNNDATRIMQYFVFNGNFAPNNYSPRGNWTFWDVDGTISANPSLSATILVPSIIVDASGSTITRNFYGSATGDFNRSFTPGSAKSASENVTLNYRETKQVTAEKVFELPVHVSTSMEVGAISLVMNIPSSKMEVVDVYMRGNNDQPIMYAVDGNELRIGWYSLTPLTLNANDELFVIKLKASGSLSKSETVKVELASTQENELANGVYDGINNANLYVEVLKTTGTGTLESASMDINLTSRPNPFQGNTTFIYSLPLEGSVSMEITNVLGAKVLTLAEGMQSAGDHTINLDATNLKPGVYTATLTFQSNNTVMTRTIKIVRN